MSDAEVDKLPDPDLWRDAQYLAHRGSFSPTDLDLMDEGLYQLTWRLMTTRAT